MMKRASLLLLLLALSQPAFAQTVDMESAPVVRRPITWRTHRSELMPTLGITINDPYIRNFIVSVGYNYHVTDWLSFGASAGWAFPIKTGLADDVEAEKKQTGKSYPVPATHLGLMANAHVGVVPLFGKVLLLGTTAISYDLHLVAGFGMVQVRWNADAASRINAEDSFKPAPVLGGGLRFFVDRGVAVNFEVLDYLAKMSVVAPDYEVQQETWTNNVAALLSFSIMMPSETTYEE